MRYEREWRPAEKKPVSKKWFDLCLLDLGGRTVVGWWTGTNWEGLRYGGEEVKRWKYKPGGHS
jgi:hypothetical protein